MSVSKNTKTYGEVMIADLDGLLSGLRSRVDDVAELSRSIAMQWDGICKTGGGRADHAASLLAQLAPALGRVANYATTAQAQVEDIRQNPWK